MKARKTWVIVANSTRSFALEKTGASNQLNALSNMNWQADKPKDNADRPGRSFASVGEGRSAMEPHVNRQSEEDIFAQTIVDELKQYHRAGRFDALILVAGSHMLASLRDAASAAFGDLRIETLPKNLVNVPTDEIEKHLDEAGIR